MRPPQASRFVRDPFEIVAQHADQHLGAVGALTSDRVYRKRYNNDKALAIIYEESEGKFEPKLLKLLKNCVAQYPSGSLVKLNTGETAIVLRNNSSILNRPIIKLLTDANGNKIENSPEIDISQNGSSNNIEIESII